MTGIKNLDKSTVLHLKEQIAYQPGQVVSRTLAQNEALSVTLFSFDKGEEISTHESGGDAFVTCLDGVGRITIDGVNVRDIKRDVLRKNIAMVLQDTHLFTGTIRENIRYGRPDATDAEVEAAARAARCDHFIHTLAGGYDFMINEEGTNLSQGQRQLVTIARAILADRPALILDEATSNVDTRTEELIQRAMDALMQGRTSFVIAHRLSTIRNADVILVIRDGDIVEKGTHDELLAQGGFYADLYNSQFDEAA